MVVVEEVVVPVSDSRDPPLAPEGVGVKGRNLCLEQGAPPPGPAWPRELGGG